MFERWLLRKGDCYFSDRNDDSDKIFLPNPAYAREFDTPELARVFLDGTVFRKDTSVECIEVNYDILVYPDRYTERRMNIKRVLNKF